jgi:hypothetical protein
MGELEYEKGGCGSERGGNLTYSLVCFDSHCLLCLGPSWGLRRGYGLLFFSWFGIMMHAELGFFCCVCVDFVV